MRQNGQSNIEEAFGFLTFRTKKGHNMITGTSQTWLDEALGGIAEFDFKTWDQFHLRKEMPKWLLTANPIDCKHDNFVKYAMASRLPLVRTNTETANRQYS